MAHLSKLKFSDKQRTEVKMTVEQRQRHILRQYGLNVLHRVTGDGRYFSIRTASFREHRHGSATQVMKMEVFDSRRLGSIPPAVAKPV